MLDRPEPLDRQTRRDRVGQPLVGGDELDSLGNGERQVDAVVERALVLNPNLQGLLEQVAGWNSVEGPAKSGGEGFFGLSGSDPFPPHRLPEDIADLRPEQI